MDITSISQTSVSTITLQSISENAAEIFYQLRWNGQVCCPVCGSIHIYNPEPDRLHICADCKTRFSDTSGTIFHSTKLSMSKWLFAIYLFLTSSRGISSYALARYIQVTQSTAWTMLMKLRACLGRDIKFDSDDQVAIDEVYLGAQWSYKPAYKKYKQAGAPPKHWNLNEKETKQWYKKRFYELAAEDKMPILGLVSLKHPKIRLVGIQSSDRQKFIQSEINHCFKDIIKRLFVDVPMTVVTDQSRLYECFASYLDHNNRPKFNHQVCRHDLNKYKSADGSSSNRLEAAFSHLRRSWRGVYCHWSRFYNQLYLDEYCFRYNNPLSSKTVILDRIKEFFTKVDPRCWSFC